MMRFKITVLLSVLLILTATSCTKSTQKNVYLALQKEDKVYLHSDINMQQINEKLPSEEFKKVFEEKLKEKIGGSNAIPSTQIVPKNGKLYTTSAYLKRIVDLLAGNYKVEEKTEKSFDGYVYSASEKVFKKTSEQKSTEKIGQMIFERNIYLTKLVSDERFHIQWEYSPEEKAIKNCEAIDVWVDRSYKPGRTTFELEQMIMIELKPIADFYGKQINYNEEDGVLYIVEIQ